VCRGLEVFEVARSLERCTPVLPHVLSFSTKMITKVRLVRPAASPSAAGGEGQEQGRVEQTHRLEPIRHLSPANPSSVPINCSS